MTNIVTNVISTTYIFLRQTPRTAYQWIGSERGYPATKT